MRRILYLGLNTPTDHDPYTVHLPSICIVPRPFTDVSIQNALKGIQGYTHIIANSQTAASLFFEYALKYETEMANLSAKTYVAVGTKTAQKLGSLGARDILISQNETAEGVIALLQQHDLSTASVFWPHSVLSRPVIRGWLKSKGITHKACPFYNTVLNPKFPKPDLSGFDEIVFTSPSTVDAFLHYYGSLPENIVLKGIGPITQNYLNI